MSGHQHNVTGVAGKLKYGLIITAVILVAEVVGGLLSNSLALLSDAGHVLADGIALLLSWYGVRQAERAASHRMTFGYHRVGVLIAIVNAVSIVAIAGVIIYEAFQRFQSPPEINSILMLVIAVVGLVANIFVAVWLHADRKENINVRSAFWHAAGDALASVGVIVGAVVIMFTGLNWVDAAVSILISVIILISAWGIFREGLGILLEGVPHHMDVMEIADTIKNLPDIRDVHDLHVWSISSNLYALSCHVTMDDVSLSRTEEIRRRIEDVAREKYGIGHTTIQAECRTCGAGDLFCQLTVGENDHHHDHEHDHK
jgi:cobalt-zinc-cadmium efflux system protein